MTLNAPLISLNVNNSFVLISQNGRLFKSCAEYKVKSKFLKILIVFLIYQNMSDSFALISQN